MATEERSTEAHRKNPEIQERPAGCPAKEMAAKKKKRKKHRKSLPVRELRALIAYFRSKDDAFSLWIVGYIILASRLGWRAGEILILQREGNIFIADAEKRTNQRGLTVVSNLDIWIADTRKWWAYYGGLSKLQDNINSRLAMACKKRKIKRSARTLFDISRSRA